jgi:hypothetical protein
MRRHHAKQPIDGNLLLLGWLTNGSPQVQPQRTARMKKLLLALALTSSLATGAHAATIFGTDGSRLVSFDSAAPGTFTSDIAISGTTASLLALDYRDSNGLIYALGNDLRIYTLDQFTGFAAAVTNPLALDGTNFGFDFNTAIDRLRIVSNTDANYVVNVNDGSVGRFTDVAFAAGDRNAGANAVVTGNGYIHGTATQFAIDTTTDSLATQANNAGTLTTVGALGVNVGPQTSFDIGFDGVGYLQDGTGFHTVSLATGAATRTGTTSRALFGITAIAPVPEPSTWAMMLLGFFGIGAGMRQSKVRKAQVAYS